MTDPSPATAPRCPECGAPRANPDDPACARCGAALHPDPEDRPPSPEALARRALGWRVADRATAAIVVVGFAQRLYYFRHFSAGVGLAVNLGATALSLAVWWAIHARVTPALTAWTVISALAVAASALGFALTPASDVAAVASWVIGAAYAVSLTWARVAVAAR